MLYYVYVSEVLLMKASIVTDQLDQDLETALKIAYKQGYHDVELHSVFGKSIEECGYFETETIMKLLKKYDMRVTCIASTIFFLCPLYEKDEFFMLNKSFHAIHGDIDTHLRYLKNACRIARRLSCSRIRIFPFHFPDNTVPPFGTQREIQDILKNMRRALSIAKQHDITLVLENSPYSRLPKGMMSIQIIKAIHDPHMRLLWNPANTFCALSKNVPKEYLTFSSIDELRYIYPYIDHIHLMDYSYHPSCEKPFENVSLLQGDVDYENILAYLHNNSYSKYLSLEPQLSKDETLKSMNLLNDILRI